MWTERSISRFVELEAEDEPVQDDANGEADHAE